MSHTNVSQRFFVVAFLMVAVLLTPSLFAQDAAPASDQPEWTRPAFKLNRRFNEDWSVMSDQPADMVKPLDSIKHIALNESGSNYISFGGSVRARVEGWNGFNFGAPATADHNDAFLLTRLLVHSDLHLGENLRVFAEGKSALSTDRDLIGGKRTLDVDNLDLQQLFADITVPVGEQLKITVRPGRQELLLGSQRLISPLAWSNTRRTWDGVSVIADTGHCSITGFWTQFVPVKKYDFNTANAQTQVWGVWANSVLPSPSVNVDLYYLGLKLDDAVTFNGTMGSEERHTVGGRLKGGILDTPFDYDVEGAYQFGSVGAGDVDAYMFTSVLGYKFADAPTAPRLYAGFDYASGDDSAGGDVQTFNHLFPLGHAYLGYIDQIGRQNIMDVSVGIAIKPTDKLLLKLDGHNYWRASTNDALYNAGGGVVRAGAAGTSSFVGSEIDFTAKYKFNPALTGQAGYSHFFAGDFIEESGPSDDIDFVYFQLEFIF